MKFKKIEDMNYYEIMDVSRSASQEEIHRAYQICKQAYSRSSMALYSLIKDAEREDVLEKIEQAYSVLGVPQKRKKYDQTVLHMPPRREEDSYFRTTTGKLIIEDGDQKKGLSEKLKRFFTRKKS
ncbi:MAG: DnaJ domain-containing protein [Candidatus Aminicenantes bacterium]